MDIEKKPKEAQTMKEKDRSEFQQSELKAGEDQMRKEMEVPMKKKNKVEIMIQYDKDSLMSQFEKERRNIKKETNRSELQLKDIQARKAQIIKKKEDIVEEKDEIERLQADKESLVLLLNEKTRNMEKEKERHNLQLRLSETREAQMKKEMEDLEKKKDEIKRRLQADRRRLVLKLEVQTSIMRKQKKKSDLQQMELKAKERRMQEEIETLVKERDIMFRKFIDEKSRSLLQLKEKIRKLEKEKGGSDLQQQESEARKAQMREDVEMLLNEIDEIWRTCSSNIDSLGLQFLTETVELEKEKEQPELQQHETRKFQMNEDVEMLKEIDEMWRTCQVSTESVGLQLMKEKKQREKDKMQSALQQRETEVRNTQMKDKAEALGKQREEVKRLQADKDSLVLQIEMEKERCEEMERSRQLVRRDWIKQYEILGEKNHENEKILKEMTVELEALKGTMETLRQKAGDVKCKTLKNFVPRWLQKLWKKNNIKMRQNLKKVRKNPEDKILEMAEGTDESERAAPPSLASPILLSL